MESHFVHGDDDYQTISQDEDEGWDEAWDKDGGQVKLDGALPEVVKPGTQNDERAPLLSSMKVNDNKAGMQGLDRDKINSIIYEASKGSQYYENELRKEKHLLTRIEEQQKKLEHLTPALVMQGVKEADKVLSELEKDLDLTRTIVHIDMDAFYAAVETRDNPALKNVPMAVGGSSMLSTSNYLARKFGVRAAMPGFIGRKLCPDLVIVPPHFDRYQQVSQEVRDILLEYDPNMCPMSLDEAYLDITEHLTKRQGMSETDRTYPRCSSQVMSGDADVGVDEQVGRSDGARRSDEVECQTFGVAAEDAVKEMRFRIEMKTQLTASAGIASNKLLAKICSDKNKPNGQFSLEPSRVAISSFVKDLPIRKVCGIGKVSERMLSAIGVVMCADVFTKRGVLFHLYSDISFHHFLSISLGVGSTTVERSGQRKSISSERTFRELHQPDDLFKKCQELCESVRESVIEEQIAGKTVTVKMKTVNFEVKIRSHSLPSPTQDMDQIFSAAKDLLKMEIHNSSPNPLRLRLMGVRLSNLCPLSECGNERQFTITSLLNRRNPSSTQVSQSQAAAQQSHDQPSVLSAHKSPKKETQPTKVGSWANERIMRSYHGGTTQKKISPTSESVLNRVPFGAIFAPINVDSATISCMSVEKVEEPTGLPGSINNITPGTEKDTFPTTQIQTESSTICESSSLFTSVVSVLVGDEGDVNDPLNRDGQTLLGMPSHDQSHDQPSDKSNSSAFICPVCSQTLTHISLSDFNNHIDLCLYTSQRDSNSVKDSVPSSPAPSHSSTADQLGPVQCPVCHLVLPQRDLTLFNQHVDTCLNKGAIRKMIQDQDKRLPRLETGTPSSKRHKQSPKPIQSFFKSNKPA